MITIAIALYTVIVTTTVPTQYPYVSLDCTTRNVYELAEDILHEARPVFNLSEDDAERIARASIHLFDGIDDDYDEWDVEYFMMTGVYPKVYYVFK